MDDQQLHTRARRAIGALSSSGVPAPNYHELRTRTTPRTASHRGPLLAIAAVVVVAVFGGVVALVRSDGSDGGGSVSSCGEIVGINGRIYQRDNFNDDALPVDELGEVIGAVDQQWNCDDGDRSIPEDVIVASLLTPRTELRSIGSGPASSTIAAVLDGRVVVYQAADVDRLSFTAPPRSPRPRRTTEVNTQLRHRSHSPTLVRVRDDAAPRPEQWGTGRRIRTRCRRDLRGPRSRRHPHRGSNPHPSRWHHHRHLHIATRRHRPLNPNRVQR